MELLGFLLAVLAIAFVIAKVIFSSKEKMLASNDLTKDKGDEDSCFIDVPTARGTPFALFTLYT